jgi:hypothetical protein
MVAVIGILRPWKNTSEISQIQDYIQCRIMDDRPNVDKNAVDSVSFGEQQFGWKVLTKTGHIQAKCTPHS